LALLVTERGRGQEVRTTTEVLDLGVERRVKTPNPIGAVLPDHCTYLTVETLAEDPKGDVRGGWWRSDVASEGL
jgi:hypothetical protein